MRVGGVEQVLEREEVDVVQRDQEGGAPAPHEDEDRQDRMCPRRSRLRRLGETRGPSTFRAEAGGPYPGISNHVVEPKGSFSGMGFRGRVTNYEPAARSKAGLP